jgi:ATP-dependent RNA helicase SUPV3L1/SUV3
MKQIAGRAGRYGGNYAVGHVTTYADEDLELMHQLKSEVDVPVTRAGLRFCLI